MVIVRYDFISGTDLSQTCGGASVKACSSDRFGASGPNASSRRPGNLWHSPLKPPREFCADGVGHRVQKLRRDGRRVVRNDRHHHAVVTCRPIDRGGLGQQLAGGRVVDMGLHAEPVRRRRLDGNGGHAARADAPDGRQRAHGLFGDGQHQHDMHGIALEQPRASRCGVDARRQFTILGIWGKLAVVLQRRAVQGDRLLHQRRHL